MSRYLIVLLIGILSIVSLILSIIYLTKCKDNFGGDILNPDDCNNSGLSEEAYSSCVRNMEILSSNINSQYQGQPANRGITYPGEADAGAFGDANILEPEELEESEDL
jgi:hypothetical protein